MLNTILLYISSGLPFAWGIAHLFPTKSVVKGFGDITSDNANIIAMEWIVEGVALIFIGFLIFLVTIVDPHSPVTIAVYWSTFAALNVLSVISLFTGFRVNFIPFKLCPVIFTGSSVVLLLGMLL